MYIPAFMFIFFFFCRAITSKAGCDRAIESDQLKCLSAIVQMPLFCDSSVDFHKTWK